MNATHFLMAPVSVLDAAAFMDKWWRGFTWRNVSFRNVAYLFDDPATRLSIVNTLILSVGVAAVVALAGALLAVVLAGRRGALAGLIRQVAMFPLGIPHVVAAVLVTLAWYGTPFHLGGTLGLLSLGYMMIMLPYGLRNGEAARGQIDTALAEAAQSVGCSPGQVLRHVLLPLMKNGIVSSFVIVFLFVIKEFSFTSMVYSAGTKTLAVQIYGFLEGGSYEPTAAASLLLMMTAFLVLFGAERIFRVSIVNLKV